MVDYVAIRLKDSFLVVAMCSKVMQSCDYFVSSSYLSEYKYEKKENNSFKSTHKESRIPVKGCGFLYVM